MNFRSFLQGYVRLRSVGDAAWGEKTRLFAIVRGKEATRAYISRMIEEGLGNPSKDVVFLREIYESLWQYLSFSPKPMRILFWEKDLLDKETASKFIEAVSMIKNRQNIFFDSSDELYKLVREEYKGKLRVRFIDCRLPSDSQEKARIYKHWFTDIEQGEISPKMVNYLGTLPYLESFNLLEAFKVVGEKDFNLVSVKKWGFIWADRERFLIDTLLYKGRVAALREDLKDLNTGRFLTMLLREIDALLKIKTLQRGYPTDRAEKAGLSLGKFYALRKRAEKLNLKELYKQLYLVVSLLKWKEFPGVVNLLFMYW